MATVLNIDVIVSDEGVRGGRPTIAGTTLRVSDVAAYHTYGGLSPEEIAVQFRLALAQVYAALAYYYMHKAEIDAEMHGNADEAEGWRQKLLEQGLLKPLG